MPESTTYHISRTRLINPFFSNVFRFVWTQLAFLYPKSLDNQREAALKEYFEKMSELLLHENLRHSDPDAEVRKIARVWALTVDHVNKPEPLNMIGVPTFLPPKSPLRIHRGTSGLFLPR
jgi:hypothetical protein